MKNTYLITLAFCYFFPLNTSDVEPKHLHTFAHAHNITSCNIDKNSLTALAQNGSIITWQLNNKPNLEQKKIHLKQYKDDPIIKAVLSPDSSHVILASNKMICFVDIHNKILKQKIAYSGSLTCLAQSANNRFVAMAFNNNVILIYDAHTKKTTLRTRFADLHWPLAFKIKFSSDSKVMITGFHEDFLFAWGTETFKPTSIIQKKDGLHYDFAISHDCKKLASCHARNIFLHKIKNGELIKKSTKSHDWRRPAFSAISFSPNDSFIATGDNDGRVTLLCAKSLRLLTQFKTKIVGHTSWIASIAFNAYNSKMAIRAAKEKTIEVWHIEDEKIARLKALTIAFIKKNNINTTNIPPLLLK